MRHSRATTRSSVERSPLAIAIASDSAMLNCTVPTPIRFCPTIRRMASFTRSRSAVNGVAGLPTPSPIAAMRSDGSRWSTNAAAALVTAIAAPNRIFGSSIAIMIRRPPENPGNHCKAPQHCVLPDGNGASVVHDVPPLVVL